MKKRFITIAVLAPALLAACGLEAPIDANVPELANITPDYGDGTKTYARYCSGCHDNGTNGAPLPSMTVTWGEPQATWRKTMEQHIQKQYIDKPQSIAGPGLSEKTFADSVYYMTTQPGNRQGGF